jgi:phage-related protein
VSDQAERPRYATVIWEGDSKEVLHSFPDPVRQNLGFQLWQLQQGERPIITDRCLRLVQAFSSCATKMRERGTASSTRPG